MTSLKNKITEKMVEKVGVQRTPGANPEMYKTDDYSVHLKGDNSVHKPADNLQTGTQTQSEVAEAKTST